MQNEKGWKVIVIYLNHSIVKKYLIQQHLLLKINNKSKVFECFNPDILFSFTLAYVSWIFDWDKLNNSIIKHVFKLNKKITTSVIAGNFIAAASFWCPSMNTDS